MMLKQPFWGYLACLLEPKETTSVPTFATDGKHLFYNKKFLDILTEEETKTIFVHEIEHIAFNHFERRGQRNLKIYGMACDYAVNDCLARDGFVLPDREEVRGLYDQRFSHMSAEKIYEILIEEFKNKPILQYRFDVHLEIPNPSQDQDGVKQNKDKNRGQEKDEQDKDKSQSQGQKNEPNKDNDKDQEPQLTINQDALNRMKEEIVLAVNIAKRQGNVPSSMESIVKELVKPSIDWRRFLYKFLVNHLEKEDYTYTRPNRKYMPQGLIMPTLRSPALPPVAIWIDSSGSISDEDLQRFLSEIVHLGRCGWNFDCHIFVGDAKVQWYGKFKARDIKWEEIKLKGRGGTSFIPFFQEIADKHIKPCCAIALTDGQGEYPQHIPSYPTLWMLTDEYNVPFGIKIVMEKN